MRKVYVVTVEQWYASNWDVSATFSSFKKALAYVRGPDGGSDCRIYECDEGGCTGIPSHEWPPITASPTTGR